MEQLTKFLVSITSLSALFLIFFKIIYNLGRRDKQNEIKDEILTNNRKQIKKIIATQNWIRSLSNDVLNKLLRKNKK